MKIAAALIAASLVAAPALAQDGPPNIVGVWKGTSDGLSEKYGWVTGPVTLTITEQKGRAFRGTIVYPARVGTKSETLVGSFAADGKNIFLAGDDGIHIASLQGMILDACYLEHGDNDGLALCASLQKQP